jgi:tetratricopeptide (TPR) repeat protein
VPLVTHEPTPLATPAGDQNTFHLKPWSESAALELVDTMLQYAVDDNFPNPYGQQRIHYQSDQRPIQVAVQEALQRYSATTAREKLKWRLALSDVVLDRPTSDEWILVQLEIRLNNGEADPETLDAVLKPYGLQVKSLTPAKNLFGDDQPAWVILITLQDRDYSGGLFAALRQSQNGRWQLIKIYSRWDFNFGARAYQDPLLLEDHTQDGVPEVILGYEHFNGTMSCASLTYIFQWQADHFAQLIDGLVADACSIFEESWMYGPADSHGIESIDVTTYKYGSVISYVDHYVWNGERYELVSSAIAPPGGFTNQVDWLNENLETGRYQAIIDDLLPRLAQTPSADELPLEHNYLWFQVGQAYALLGRTEAARQAFEQASFDLKRPGKPLDEPIAEAARIYLAQYQGQEDLYRACQATLKFMAQAAGGTWPPDDWPQSRYFENHWGFQPSFDFLPLCSLRAALRTVLQGDDFTPLAQLSQKLGDLGVEVLSFQQADLNGDGLADGLLMAATPANPSSADLWVLLNSYGKWAPLSVIPLSNIGFELLATPDAVVPPKITTLHTPDGQTIVIVQPGKSLFGFQIHNAKGQAAVPRIEFLFTETSFDSYRVIQDRNHLELEFKFVNNNCTPCINIERWKNGRFEYDFPDEPQKDQVAEAESALLERWQPEAAIPLLIPLTEMDWGEQPRELYLLGLAYEMDSEETLAAETYWQLWREHPESAYALMAQAKIEQ